MPSGDRWDTRTRRGAAAENVVPGLGAAGEWSDGAEARAVRWGGGWLGRVDVGGGRGRGLGSGLRTT
jgi:hypothetical protein